MYSFENKKKRIMQAKRGNTISSGSILVDRTAWRMPATPPVNVSALEPKYAGATWIRNGEIMMAPRTSGNNQTRKVVLRASTLLAKIAPKNTVANVMATNIMALRE
jgi:hypothetical protein